ncbi:hypothetical protein PHYBOEH_001087 [Phytophthora boehmeriae]|uniref:Uncharacterized protein n=1 Tax=Phytophthora boehmeriae TaxID=109152 RepID=A0A8T1V881_9STRA|nr:hypothetical protein PHYBOEH_001087 [Phytophthora boehmeriae]
MPRDSRIAPLSSPSRASARSACWCWAFSRTLTAQTTRPDDEHERPTLSAATEFDAPGASDVDRLLGPTSHSNDHHQLHGKLKVLSARRNTLVGRSAGGVVQPIAEQILGERSGVQVMNLEGNPMSKEDLQEMDGFDAFLTRRTKLKNKEIHGGLNSDLSLCGLE